MSQLIVGTAGHIDHGKSALVHCLTGIDPDRLGEEKARGITIELGFADLDLGDGRIVSFVDVPGHERFVRHMVAGATGIGAVMLVIAADEGVKPQTREHLQICGLLDVPRGLIALNKCDLVDDELAEVAELELRDALRGTFLEGAPIVRVSALDRTGLDALRGELAALVESTRPPAAGATRLPVDRSFSQRGFGTVVTGSLVAGSIATGDELEVLPGARRVRVRGLQVHRRAVASAAAGQRVAVNLQGIEREGVPRGSSLVQPGRYRTTRRVWAAVELLPGAPDSLARGGPVTFHVGTSECPARLRWRPGPSGVGCAELFLRAPLVCAPGDRFILRRPAPVNTVGGGRVLEAHPPRRADPAAWEALVGADSARRLEWRVDSEGDAGAPLERLALRCGATPEQIRNRLREAGAGFVHAGGRVYTPRRWSELRARALERLGAFHAREPLRSGISREELRTVVQGELPQDAWRALLDGMAADGRVRVEGEIVALGDHRIALEGDDLQLYRRIEAAFQEGALEPPEPSTLAGEAPAAKLGRVVDLLVERGALVRTSSGRLYHAEALERLGALLREHARRSKRIDVATFKELAGVTRKNAIPLLEHLDERRLTRRVGNEREILL